MIKIKVSDVADYDSLLSSEAYKELIGAYNYIFGQRYYGQESFLPKFSQSNSLPVINIVNLDKYIRCFFIMSLRHSGFILISHA
jgi:hypothetical protein